MFWGLILEPNKRYTQSVQKSFHISMAALDASPADSSNVQVMLGLNDKNYLLCTLNKSSILQTPLDLNFQEGNKISFLHNGKGYVHLTGYFVPEDDLDEFVNEEESEDEEVPQLVESKSLKRKSESLNEKKKTKKKKSELLELLNNTLESDENDDSFNLESDEDDDDDDNDNDSDDVNDFLDDDNDDDNDDQEDEDSDNDENDEMNVSEDEIEEKKSKKQKKKKQLQLNGVAEKKQKNISETTPTKKDNKTQKSPTSIEKVQQNNVKKNENQRQKKKKEKKLNTESSGNENSTPLKKQIEGGVHIEDLKVGNGSVAKPGKFVQVYYEGRLKSNGKQFDSSKTGPGFKFRLGKQEVIQGWDVGVAGMKVGGRRRITCPPNMAYGAKGSPPVIPPNSTLVFEVELKNVN